MARRATGCRVSPLFIMGAVLLPVGGFLYSVPGGHPGILAAGALVLGALAAWWCASRQG
ncbi:MULTISPECIES: hypothetical protein [unclassified Streptomyces]|uniref:hypothetical protein n=1 Tax=unclassified Streptomyces TaxID=2593676 RepID=UPI0022717D6D|nr:MULTISPECIES: hypothetical protein [unclassified Streptomyces]MCY0922558.1 hypothetical protein [Streptomyces sp. H27-G5]MCY0963162.1 hypothetical protein [Streptomyces sp. H27-H5]